MSMKNRTYNQRKRILQKQFKSSMIYTPEEAKTLMETILKEKVDLEFIRRYLEEHDCILIEKKKNRNERNIIQNPSILKENSDIKQHRVKPLTSLKTKNLNKNIPKVGKSNNQRKLTSSISLEARNELIEKNLNLIRKYARDYEHGYMNHKLEYDDLVSEGVFGLVKAIEKYDQSYGTAFSTYAVHWIRQAMIRAIINIGTTVRIPVYKIEQIRKLRNLEQEFIRDYGELRIEEICETLDITVEEYKNLKIIEHRYLSYISLEREIMSDEGLTLIGAVLTEQKKIFGNHEYEYGDPAEMIEEKEKTQLLKAILLTLDGRERKIVSMRFGLIDGKESTLEKIGKELGLTRERVRQIEDNALKRLRSKIRKKKIKEIFF